MSSTPTRVTREQQQQRTRDALVLAARDVFARQGYHAAGLDLIAREAGFSKGAVYSNFEGKADLFLAVMDANLGAAGTQGWDVFERVGPCATADEVPADVEGAMRGFALATLEFIATAARDRELAGRLTQRVQVMVDLYADVTERSGAPEGALSRAEVAAVLAALDQGAALLALGGVAAVDQSVLRAAMQRLVDPSRAAGIEREGGTGGGLHDQEIARRIASSVSS
ncbi:TetR/AcrR family transcriptional regulator [Cellulomonas bogoriensis]|uniref:TetR family transcriptional regulator n=1 Tax=Cellulomonas bogoriensis 69B4 = DSM 16987 TaxID=1386082 RepID=A0A0A0C1D0_9CELL|nr:helix-turn-helix domain-containing protein [Cellulomonas bogoriensis]KGM14005.1 TetR family transcriptional regulator [Cellulomonas bogoriensis 69B4 = DSM 16987]